MQVHVRFSLGCINKMQDCAGPGVFQLGLDQQSTGLCRSRVCFSLGSVNKMQDCAGPGVFQLGLDQQGAGLCRCMCVSASVQK